MDPMTLPGGDNPVVWLLLLGLLVLATWRVRSAADDPLAARPDRFRVSSLLINGRDRSSFRYRRGR